MTFSLAGVLRGQFLRWCGVVRREIRRRRFRELSQPRSQFAAMIFPPTHSI